MAGESKGSNEMENLDSLSISSTRSQNIMPTSPSLHEDRLWRPAAQRNLRNQWSKLLSHKDEWFSASRTGKSHATSLVNAHLSQRYIPEMDLGVLSKMPNIRLKARVKLCRQQKLYKSELLSAYKLMVNVVSCMIDACGSMRCFLKGSSDSPIVRFCSQRENPNDNGDGRGAPVFTCMSIPFLENLGRELAGIFVLELGLKRLLVIELLSISCGQCTEEENTSLSCSDELYHAEFDELRKVGLYVEEQGSLLFPRVNGWDFYKFVPGCLRYPDHEVLQVYLTAWLVEVNIDRSRVDEIFSIVSEEMHIRLS